VRKSPVVLLTFVSATTLYSGINTWTSNGPGGGNILALAIGKNAVYAITGGGDLFKSTDAGTVWKAANSGLTSAVFGLVIDTEDMDTLYAWGGELFKSTDGAQSWNKLNVQSGIATVVPDPQESTTLYAAAGNRGILKSVDGGANWTSANSGLTAPGVYTLSISGGDPATLYAGTSSAFGAVNLGPVFRSSDGAATWVSPLQQSFLRLGLPENNTCDTWNFHYAAITGRQAPPADQLSCYPPDNRQLEITLQDYLTALHTFANRRPDAVNFGLLPNPRTLLADPHDPKKVYALTSRGIFISADGALTWNDANRGFPGAFNVAAIAIDATHPDTLYAGFSFGGRLYKSVDGGLNWDLFSLPGNGGVNALAIDPQNSGTIYAGSSFGLFKSTDAAISWSSREYGLADANVFSMLVDPQNRGVIYATVGGGSPALYKSQDSGTTWVRNDLSGMITFGILAIDPHNPDILYAGGNCCNGSLPALLKSTDAGQTWFPTGLQQLPGRLQIDPRDSNALYAVSGLVGGGVIKSSDGGSTWRSVNSGLGGSGNNVPQISNLVMDPQAPDTLYCIRFSDGQMFKSTDGGASWNPIKTGWDGTLFHALFLVADPQNSGTLYAGTGEFDCGYFDICPPDYFDKIKAAGGAGMFKSTDGGFNWVRLDTPGAVQGYFGFYSVAIDPRHTSNLYVASDYPSHILRSTDGGETWSVLQTPFKTARVSALAVDGQDPSTLYAGTLGGGVFAITFVAQ
jgi:photosystem II stability/assembly factor-like uncharacterized protein